jgi:hypothetical protein
MDAMLAVVPAHAFRAVAAAGGEVRDACNLCGASKELLRTGV